MVVFFFLLQLQLNFDCNDLRIMYIDEDYDAVELSSQEELHQAFRVKSQSNNDPHTEVKTCTHSL